MLPCPMPRFEPSANDSSPPPATDLTRSLEKHVQAGFPPDLALDLVLNQLVTWAADATHASAAALALVRGDEMVCRAATGLHAPDLGIPLNIRDGLSGACIRTRAPQLSTDTESDSRVDGVTSRRLGIRSILIVPVFDDESNLEMNIEERGEVSEIRAPQLAGVLEVFSPLPNAFSHSTQSLLEGFARDCQRVRKAAAQLCVQPPAEIIAMERAPWLADGEAVPAGVENSRSEVEPEVLSIAEPTAELTQASPVVERVPPLIAQVRQPYEGWTLTMGAIVIFAAAAVSFMIGSRIGWIRGSQPALTKESPLANSGGDLSAPMETPKPASAARKGLPQTKPSAPANATKDGVRNKDAAGGSDELVVYEKGKVIFRMNPAPQNGRATSQPQSASSQSASAQTLPLQASPAKSGATIAHAVWLAPEQAELRLVNRVEPQYPADALAAHRSGNVTLELRVAEDGTVSSVRVLNGDPLLAAAATQSVRSWRYQPYRLHDKPSAFQTDVTLTFSLPN